ncbi:MAG: hypothetical protein M3384_19630 [Acidobacteriota bacterium]|nr:hypothetical protein [Acidobacteriota bacterium]
MPVTPIKTSANADFSASSTAAGKSAQAQANASAAPPQNQNSEAFRQVNRQLTGGNNSQGNQNNQAAHGRAEGNHAHGGNSSAHASMQGSAQVSVRGGSGNHNGNQGSHGVHQGSQSLPQANRNEVGDGGRHGNGNGNAHAYGRAEGHVQNNGGSGNNKGGNPLNINIDFSAHAQANGNSQSGNNIHATAHAQINNHSAQAHANHSTRARINSSAPPNTPPQSTNLNLDLSLNLNGGGNHNGVVRSVLNRVLRENDIYLNQNVIRHFVNENFSKAGNGNVYGNKRHVPIPPEMTQIVRIIRTQLANVLNNPPLNFNGNVRVTIQNSAELASLIHTSRGVLLQNFGAKPFVSLNLQARMYIAAELILKYLPKFQPNVFSPNHSAKQILNGLLLARGFAITADKFFPRHDIFSAKKFPLPYNVPPAVIRNLGNAVKSLIVEARLAQTPKDLEAAVQKLLRNLSGGGKNNLDALRSAVELAAQLGVRGNVEAGEAALPEKIAELVKFLILAGDRALQSVADAFDAAEAEMLAAQNADNSESAELERNREIIRSGEKAIQAEGALRRQLEFNPFLQNERAASAFENPGEASRAREEFLNRYHHEIEQWLQSGNHRFVRDIELEKPVGIVVERGTSGFFTADRARIVLVRDGSVQGWHFLKSFLVK